MKLLKEKFYKDILYPIFNLKYGPRYGLCVNRLSKDLDKLQWLSSDEVLVYQTNKLKKLVNHIYNNVPYYKKIMKNVGLKPEDINSLEDFNSFPVLTKEDIRTHYNSIISTDIKQRRIRKASTGGTTGEPITILRDLETYIWTKTTQLRGMSWADYKFGNDVVFFTSFDKVSSLGKIRNNLINYHFYPAMAKEYELLNIIKELRKLQPFFITGYASNIYRILSAWNKHQIDDVKIKGILSTGEMLYEYQRDFFKQKFNCRTFDYYGCNEIGSLAYECEHGSMHISDEHVILETTDSYGKSLENRQGEVTVTDLDNYAMPLIRYKNGDVGIVCHDTCHCGRGLSMIKKLQGRSQDFIKTDDGNYVSGILYANRFYNLRGINKFQIVQQDVNNIILRVVKNEFFLNKELRGMIDFISNSVGDSINITVEYHSDIPITGRGKSRIVISYVPTVF